jgi:hypothetical protein
MKWLELNQIPLNEWRQEELNGVLVQVSVSPYDVPIAVRGYPDSDPGWFVIEFKYATEEELRPAEGAPHIVLLLGKNSGRIYKIRINRKALAVEKVGLELKVEKLQQEVSRAIDQALQTGATNRLSNTYDLTKKVILNNRKDLFQEFGFPRT